MSDPTTRPHSLDILDQILAGTLSPEAARKVLNTYDGKGLTPVGYAALSAARDAHSLLELKQLLGPTEGKQSEMEAAIGLIEQIASSQARQEERQARMEERQERMEHLLRQIACVLGGKPRASQTPQAATRIDSVR
jgi:hypothetical protein